MKIESIGRGSELVIGLYEGELIERDSYFVLQTPSNREYFWGNYLIFKSAPKPGSLVEWKRIFDEEFPCYKEPHHYAFTWLEPVNIELPEFKEEGFEYERTTVLIADSIIKSKNMNQEVEIRKLDTDEDWEMVYEIGLLCADPNLIKEDYKVFQRSKISNYRAMIRDSHGHWYGAFIGKQLVGDLGLFFKDGIGRYQAVQTHPDHRGQGICQRLLYESALEGLTSGRAEQLVILADPDYFAKKIYEKVGFKEHEELYSYSWHRGLEKPN